MSAPTVLLHKPASLLTVFSPKPGSPSTLSSHPDFPSSKNLVFSSPQSFPWKPVSWERRKKTPMRIAALSGSPDDEGVKSFEQEALFHGSTVFPHDSMAGGGLESTLNNLSKWLVSALFGAVILWRHDAEALWAAMGCVLNAGLSTVLKQILNQERPVSTLRSDPGMPSSHAQSIFFSAMFAVLSMVEWLGFSTLAITLGGLVLAFASYLSWLRVSQQYHTISQVVVGATLGSIFSILWFWSWNAVVLKAFIAHLWVRAVVVLGACGFCLGFLLYVIRYWVMDERRSP